jgi:beta-lactam-binding protein with PASTA domain
MTEHEPNNPPPKRIWPWLVLAGVILWIAVSVFWVWKEVQRIKRQKITAIEQQHATRISYEQNVPRQVDFTWC